MPTIAVRSNTALQASTRVLAASRYAVRQRHYAITCYPRRGVLKSRRSSPSLAFCLCCLVHTTATAPRHPLSCLGRCALQWQRQLSLIPRCRWTTTEAKAPAQQPLLRLPASANSSDPFLVRHSSRYLNSRHTKTVARN